MQTLFSAVHADGCACIKLPHYPGKRKDVILEEASARKILMQNLNVELKSEPRSANTFVKCMLEIVVRLPSPCNPEVFTLRGSIVQSKVRTTQSLCPINTLYRCLNLFVSFLRLYCFCNGFYGPFAFSFAFRLGMSCTYTPQDELQRHHSHHRVTSFLLW